MNSDYCGAGRHALKIHVTGDTFRFSNPLRRHPPFYRSSRINLARVKGISAYVGDGLNRWPAVHRLDAAHLYRLALEKGGARAAYHGVADEGVPFREIADVIGRRLNVPVVSKSPEEAVNHFSWLGHFVGVDCPASSQQTRELLGWQPTQPRLIPDIDRPNYFKSDRTASAAPSHR